MQAAGCALGAVGVLVVTVLTLDSRAGAVSAAPSPSRTVMVPTFTVAVTDSNGNTVAAVGGTATSRAPEHTPAPLANTGTRAQQELALAVALLAAGGTLLLLGQRRPRRAH